MDRLQRVAFHTQSGNRNNEIGATIEHELKDWESSRFNTDHPDQEHWRTDPRIASRGSRREE
jgi:hypothetical protein